MDHFYTGIQGWFNYQHIYTAVTDVYPSGSHFVEIGSWRGRSSTFLAVEIANSGKDIRLDCVDTWRGSVDEEIHQTDEAVINDTLYQEFLTNIEPVKHIITPVRMSSREAVKRYEDNSLEFVFVDGSHEYEEVKHDITEWLKKVKHDGTIAGDDFEWPGVKQAVLELLPDVIIHPDIGCWRWAKV